MILPILKVTNSQDIKILRAVSTDVAQFDSELSDLVTDMIETMFASTTPAAGLSAPQVGVNKNIFLMRTEDSLENETRETLVIINPVTVIEWDLSDLDIEGCLSIPGMYGRVVRHKQVGAIYYDVTGKRCPLDLSGFQARIYQHEIDHLKGVLFADKAVQLLASKKG